MARSSRVARRRWSRRAPWSPCAGTASARRPRGRVDRPVQLGERGLEQLGQRGAGQRGGLPQRAGTRAERGDLALRPGSVAQVLHMKSGSLSKGGPRPPGLPGQRVAPQCWQSRSTRQAAAHPSWSRPVGRRTSAGAAPGHGRGNARPRAPHGCLRGLVAGHNRAVTVPTTQALPHAATAWLRSSLPGCPTASSDGPFVRLPEFSAICTRCRGVSRRRQRHEDRTRGRAGQPAPPVPRPTAAVGGSQAHGLVPLAGALAGFGHDVTIYARRDAPGFQPSRSSLVPGVTVERLPAGPAGRAPARSGARAHVRVQRPAGEALEPQDPRHRARALLDQRAGRPGRHPRRQRACRADLPHARRVRAPQRCGARRPAWTGGSSWRR